MDLGALSTSLSGLLEPADALLDPGRRVFVPFLAGSVAIAAAALLARGVALRALPRRLLSPRIWLHRSARIDYQLILAKALLRAALLGSFGVSTLAVAALTAGWLRRHGGTPDLHASPLLAGLGFTLVAFLLEDWSRFYVHRLMHRVPLLWEFHKVHHSAEVLTPFTLYRTHPVEALLNGARSAAAVGLATGVCAWLLGPSLRAWQVLGVDAVGFLWTLLGANLRHSHVWVSYGRLLEHVLVSPAQHQVHHSRDPRHGDRNFGTILALWDWLGGSLYVTGRPERLRFGLASGEPAPGRGVLGLLLGPPLSAGRRLLAWPVRRAAAAALLLLAATLQLGCTSNKRIDRAALLQGMGACTLDSYRQFQPAADGLVTATAALQATPGDPARAAARAAWERAIDAWQVAELLRYGPAAGLDVVGGKGLRAEIYSWPDVNRCLIDEQIVSKAYEGAAFASTSSAARGLAALEYLLAYGGTDNGCGATSPINAMGTWAALSPDELARRKGAYAAAAAADVAARGRALLAAWEPDGFLVQLAEAGRGSRLFPTQQTALSAVADAVFHLDTEVKDRKLAQPLGIMSCAAASCPEAVESPYADRSKQHLRGNLRGLRVLMLGCPAGMDLGYDDLLEAAGAPALAEQTRVDIAAAEAAVDGLPEKGVKQALASDRPAAERVYAAMKELTDFLKMEFSMTLAITSSRVEGDHD